MPAKRPPQFEELAAKFDSIEIPPNFYKMKRKFSFGFMPKGFFSKLVVRVMHLEQIKHVSSWFSGLILEDSKTWILPRARSDSSTSPLVHKQQEKESIYLQYDEDNSILTVTGLLPVQR